MADDLNWYQFCRTGFVYMLASMSAPWKAELWSKLYTPFVEVTGESCLEFHTKLMGDIKFLVALLSSQYLPIWESEANLGNNKVFSEAKMHVYQ